MDLSLHRHINYFHSTLILYIFSMLDIILTSVCTTNLLSLVSLFHIDTTFPHTRVSHILQEKLLLLKVNQTRQIKTLISTREGNHRL
jgi:hypothetical protein